MKKILVTGDRGYIGAVLVPLLLKNNYGVVGLDTSFFQYNLGETALEKSYKKITKDIRNIEKQDLKDIDTIIHLCALSNDPLGMINGNLTHDINYLASVKLAKLAKKAGVKRFIFSSSCSVYGGNGEIPVTEKDLLDPLTAYAKSKVDTENVLLELNDKNFSCVLLRNSTVYGYSPKMRMDLVVNNLVAYAMTTGNITLLSDGKAWRPLVHVKDLAKVFMEMIKAEGSFIDGQIFNVGTNKQNQLIIDIAKEIHIQLPSCDIAFGNSPSSDKRNYKVNFNKLKKTFPNLIFDYTIPMGISELINEYKNSKLTKDEFLGYKYIRLNTILHLQKHKKINSNLYWI
jgi:nucleoside-diphosphate-sugar epimerase